MYSYSPINNVTEATSNQFLALNPPKRVTTGSAGSLEEVIAITEHQLAFFKNCKKVQDAAKEKLEKLQTYKVHSNLVVEKLKDFSSYVEFSLGQLNGIPVVIGNKYSVVCTRVPYGVEACGLCSHHTNGAYNFTVTNLSQEAPHNTFTFQKLNIHAITSHKNFSYPGNIGTLEGYEISVFDTLKILELI